MTTIAATASRGKWHIRTCPDCQNSFSSRSYVDFVRCPSCSNKARQKRVEKANKERVEKGEHRIYPWLIVYDPLDNDLGGLAGKRFTGEEIMLMMQNNCLTGCKLRQLNGSETIYTVVNADNDCLLVNGNKEHYKLSGRFYLTRYVAKS